MCSGADDYVHRKHRPASVSVLSGERDDTGDLYSRISGDRVQASGNFADSTLGFRLLHFYPRSARNYSLAYVA